MKRLIEFFALGNVGQNTSTYSSVRGWISANRFSGIQISSRKTIFLEAYNIDELVDSLSFDFQRFSCSSFESMKLSNVERTVYPATAWPLIKSYYSGFFGAHAVLNSVGLGEVYLNQQIINQIHQYAQLTGITPPNLQPGSFSFRIIESGTNPGIEITQSPSSAGVHGGFWKRLCDHLSRLLTDYVNNGGPKPSEILSEVDKIQSMVRDTHRAGVWISNTRNEINYQHLYDCWLPNRKSAVPRKLKFLQFMSSEDALSSLNHNPADLERFVSVSQYFSSLSSEMANFYIQSHGGNSAIGRRWNRLQHLLP